MPSILFVCNHNACRSRIAEAICGREAPRSWLIASAGTEPSAQPDLKAVEVLRRNGIVAAPSKPKGLAELPDVRWDFVVYLGDGDIPALPEGKKFIRWPVADPVDGPPEPYDAIFTDLKERIGGLLKFIEELSPCS
ncbi:MAG: low molecular weight phosphatase family protein [Elusimicrobia bacterium]|nr:low molecular weight phosphatase family protein [Elusimicrobiota bacterium]